MNKVVKRQFEIPPFGRCTPLLHCEGAGAPLHHHQRGLGGPREATGSRVFSPSQRFGLYSTRKFFRSSYDLFLQALLLFFNRSVKRLAKLKSNEYNGLSGNRGIP